jgi:hypothetical protein
MQRQGKHIYVKIEELLGGGVFYVVRARSYEQDSLKQQVNVRGIGQGEARYRKYNGLKLGGG